MRTRLAGAVSALSVALIVSCVPSEQVPSAPSIGTARAPAAVLARPQLDARVRAAQVTPAEFLARNPMAWVGRAHNNFLRLFLVELRKANGKNACAVMQRVLVSGAFLGDDSLKFRREARERSARTIFSKTSCNAELALQAAWTSKSRLHGAVRFASFGATSGDPSSYLTAIEAAPDQSSSVGDLSSIVSSITADAETSLSGAELDQVYAVGSIAVSSAEYWEANAVSDAEAMYPSISDCLRLAADPNTCVYDASRWHRADSIHPSLRLATWDRTLRNPSLGGGAVARASASSTRRGAAVRFEFANLRSGASNAPRRSCSDVLGWRGIAKTDITWGIAGALGGPEAALASGSAGSARSFLWRGVAYLVCEYAS